MLTLNNSMYIFTHMALEQQPVTTELVFPVQTLVDFLLNWRWSNAFE